MRATRNSGGRLADPVDALRDDIAAIKRDIAGIIESRASAMGDAVSQTLNGMRRGGTRLAASTRRSARVAHERLGKTAGARPLTTIAVAAVAGIVSFKVLGWMWRR